MPSTRTMACRPSKKRCLECRGPVCEQHTYYRYVFDSPVPDPTCMHCSKRLLHDQRNWLVPLIVFLALGALSSPGAWIIVLIMVYYTNPCRRYPVCSLAE